MMLQTPASFRTLHGIGSTLRLSVAAAAALFLAASSASAQLPQTRILSVFPPGAKAGAANLEVTISNGVDLDEVDTLVFTHPGIKAVQKTVDQGGKPNPVANTFLVTVDAAVPPGLYEVRAKGLFGLSNPRTFVVGDRDEIQETEPNNEPEKANPVELNRVVNGRANAATDVDWFKFAGQKGQRIIASIEAARIDSRLSPVLEIYSANGRRLSSARNQLRGDSLIDVTIPADGDYLLKVYDFVYAGSADHFYRLTVGNGPHIDYVFPPSALPGTTGQFTLYGRNLPGGSPAGVSLEGRPLEKLAVQIPVPSDTSLLQAGQNVSPVEAGSDGFSYVLKTPQGTSNSVILRFATAPVIPEVEPNDVGAKAQKISIPAEFVGQFQSRGDIDVVSFDAKAGEVYYVEVLAERDGSPADPYLVLDRVQKNDKGEETVSRITALDDDATNLLANVFDTKTDDVIYRFQVPADGEYRLAVRDRYFEVRGDVRQVYRLSIRKEAPDFRLVTLPVMPAQNVAQTGAQTWSVGLRKGDSVTANVLVFRRDGFNGIVEVTAEGLPAGVTCPGALVGPNQNAIQLVFTAAEDAAPWNGQVKIVGKGKIEDAEKVKLLASAKAAVKPATDAVPKLQQALTKADEDLKKANEALAKAKEAAEKDAANKGLQDAAAAAQKVADTAAAAQKKATDDLAAGTKAVADAEDAVKAAEAAHAAAIKVVTRESRAGTITINGAQGVPPTARLSQGVELSVMDEAAPIQLTITPEANRLTVAQGRTVLVPVKLARRQGFDNNVTLAFEGLPPNTNIQVENKPINKGADTELLKVTVAPNAVPGAYTLLLRGQAQVGYVRNPKKLEEAKQAQEAATKAATEAAEVLKKATADKDAATKKAADDVTAVNKAKEAKAGVDKKLVDAQAGLKRATDAKDAADKGTDEAAKTNAAKAVETEQETVKKVTDEVAAAAKVLADAEAASKVSAEAKTKADAAAVDADTKSKAATAAKTAADAAFTAATNAAKPNNVNVFVPSTPLLLEVLQAPVTLAPNVPNGGAVKRGAKLEVKVAVNRINGFTGPVTLDLGLPPNVAGLKAAPVTVAPDQKEGVLVVEAAGDATEGQLANVTVRASADFNGKASVDAVIPVKVDK